MELLGLEVVSIICLNTAVWHMQMVYGSLVDMEHQIQLLQVTMGVIGQVVD